MQVEIVTREDLRELDEKLSKIIDLLSAAKKEEPKQWLRTSDVKRMLNCSESTIKNFRDTGKLPYSRVQGTFFYRSEDVEDMLSHSK